MDGQIRPQDNIRNKIYGDRTIWAADTLEGAKNFAYENLFNNEGNYKTRYIPKFYEIYKIDLEGLKHTRLHDLKEKGQTYVHSTLRTSITEPMITQDSYERQLKRHNSYMSNLVKMNKELAIEGPITPDKIKLITETPIQLKQNKENPGERERKVKEVMERTHTEGKP